MSNGNQSLQRGLAILSELERAAESLGVREIGRRLDLNPATTQRLVNTLLDEGFLARDTERSRYSLGYKALSLGTSLLNDNRLVSSSMEVLQGLTQALEVNTFLGSLLGDQVVYLLSLQSQGPISINSRTGQPLALHSTALAKVILADLPESRALALIRARPLARFTGRTITGEDALVEHLHEIRRQGYATAIGENLTGIDSVGAVVRGSNGQVAGAISAAYAPTLQPGIRFDELTSRIVEAARDISLRLGCPASALPGERRAAAG
ncbi:IclR family transcriptional regulator [Tistrella bauzanensis]|uniref:IclR family transcriptional regulator n=1 Tax=Tistrella bauzanensis TaxID=657419 RepID=A0ABQ1ID52_9PROT|nr:IclR family transcriptional regulator [Tistrella bauzanensis]GGB35685.1 IclR family transcriptional regulator [Tistrella bauzanensis]